MQLFFLSFTSIFCFDQKHCYNHILQTMSSKVNSHMNNIFKITISASLPLYSFFNLHHHNHHLFFSPPSYVGRSNKVFHRKRFSGKNYILGKFSYIFHSFSTTSWILISYTLYYSDVTQAPPPVTLPPSRRDASCTFEDTYICNYTQIIRDNGDWTWRSGSRIQQDMWWLYYYYGQFTGPLKDHTKGTEKGICYYHIFFKGWNVSVT